VLPLFTHGSQTHPTLEELQEAGAAAAWYPALTTMAGLQASWDFLNEFQERGTGAIDDFLATAAQSRWGVASNGSILGAQRIREMEDKYLP
jgi:2-methylisocitrate lyase-like PEP mutase family enzyme